MSRSIRNTPTSDTALASIPTTNGSSADDWYESIYAYEATDPSDLSFNVGQRILVLKCDGDWWTGQIDERVGTFPNNYVEKILPTCTALTAYESTEEGYLSFDVGQLIHVKNTADQDWYEGEIRVGQFDHR
jgi:hypothetical protein